MLIQPPPQEATATADANCSRTREHELANTRSSKNKLTRNPNRQSMKPIGADKSLLHLPLHFLPMVVASGASGSVSSESMAVASGAVASAIMAVASVASARMVVAAETMVAIS